MKILQLLSFVGVFLILLFRNKNNPVNFPKYLLFYLLFVAYTTFSDIFILNREFKFDYLLRNRLYGGFSLFFIVENLKISKDYYKKVFSVSKRVLIIALVVIVIQQVYNKNFFVSPNVLKIFGTEVESQSSNVDRLHSIYSWLSPLSIGFSFIPVLLLVIEDLIKRNKKYQFVIFWIFAGLLFSMLTKHRWVMLNSFLTFVLFFIYYKRKKIVLLKSTFFLIISSVVFYITLNAVGINIGGIVEDRVFEKNRRIQSSSAGTRLLAIKAFGKLYMKRPLFGAGDYKYGMGAEGENRYELRQVLGRRSSQIHVGYLALLYRYGLIGGSFFLIFIFLLLKRLYHDAKKTGRYASFLGFFCFILANLTLVFFPIYELGFLVSLLVNNYHVKNNT